jgi:xylulokinase
MSLLAVDAGTTYCKAGLFSADGTALSIASRPTVPRPLPPLAPGAASGSTCYDPEELWAAVAGAVTEVTGDPSRLGARGPVAAVGISSMAETGLLLERATGRPRTPFLPWFDVAAAGQAARIALRDGAERFRLTGLRPSHKSGLAKLLWLRDELGVDLAGCTWLSVADYLAYRLTGQAATDYTLAARTLAFRLDRRAWDEEWLQSWGLNPGLFPPALPSGTAAGGVETGTAGLAPGTPVVIAGHDHVCAALAAGVTRPGPVLDSMGTAEVLLGTLDAPSAEGGDLALEQARFDSGLLYGLHVVPGRRFWLGSLSLSGGAVEWLRGLLDSDRLTYGELEAIVASANLQPTGILFFPAVAGHGPRTGQNGAAFVGLRTAHTRADLARAVLEGTAFEIERLRRTAEAANRSAVDRLVAVGGGTRLASWLQIKADVSGVPIEVLPQREAALLGAALLAGRAAGLIHDAAEPWGSGHGERFLPDISRHAQYRELFANEYLPLAERLAQHANAGPPSATGAGAAGGSGEARNNAL